MLVLSVHEEGQYAVAAVRAGAAGYLTKNCSPAEHLAAALGGPEGGASALSAREREVLACLASGLSGKEIAARLELSPKTVSTYRSRLLEKLEMRTTADLIRYAIERG